jgi:hypothetical protein
MPPDNIADLVVRQKTKYVLDFKYFFFIATVVVIYVKISKIPMH